MTEIAYLRSGFVRVVQTGLNCFEVQGCRFRGEGVDCHGNKLWRRLYKVSDLDKAIRLLESYS